WHRDKQPRAVAYDLGKAALRLVPVEPASREARQLDPLLPADEATFDDERIVAGERLRLAGGEDHLGKLRRRRAPDRIDAEGLRDGDDIVRGDLAPDDRAPVFCCNARYSHMIARQSLPQRQQ